MSHSIQVPIPMHDVKRHCHCEHKMHTPVKAELQPPKMSCRRWQFTEQLRVRLQYDCQRGVSVGAVHLLDADL